MCLSILCGIELFRILIVCGQGIIGILIFRFMYSYPLPVREMWIAITIHIFQGLIPAFFPAIAISALIVKHRIPISIPRAIRLLRKTNSFRSSFVILPPSTTIAVFFFVYIYKYNTINIIMQVLIIFLLHFLAFAYIFLIFLFLLLFYFLELCLQNRDLITFC